MPRDSIARGLAISAVSHPGYVAGNWYRVPIIGFVATGNALAVGSVRLLPFYLARPIKVSDLGVRIITASAGGNIRLALYASDPATRMPTGTAVVETGNISTTTATLVSLGVNAAATLQPGLYWQAVNSDNAVVVLESVNITGTYGTMLVGSATLANLSLTSGDAYITYSFASAFGAFPNLTGQAIVENPGNNSHGMLFMKAA